MDEIFKDNHGGIPKFKHHSSQRGNGYVSKKGSSTVATGIVTEQPTFSFHEGKSIQDRLEDHQKRIAIDVVEARKSSFMQKMQSR